MGFAAAFGIAGYDLQKDETYLKNWETIKAANKGGDYRYGTAYTDYSGEKLVMFVWRVEQERYEATYGKA